MSHSERTLQRLRAVLLVWVALFILLYGAAFTLVAAYHSDTAQRWVPHDPPGNGLHAGPGFRTEVPVGDLIARVPKTRPDHWVEAMTPTSYPGVAVEALLGSSWILSLVLLWLLPRTGSAGMIGLAFACQTVVLLGMGGLIGLLFVASGGWLEPDWETYDEHHQTIGLFGLWAAFCAATTFLLLRHAFFGPRPAGGPSRNNLSELRSRT